MHPPYSRTLFELLDEQARTRADAVAVICDDRPITFKALAENSQRAAGALESLGVRRGSRVGLLVNNRPEWLEVAFGAWMLGAVLVPLSTWSTGRELEYLLRDSEINVLITLSKFGREDFVEILTGLLPEAASGLSGWRSERFPRMRAVLIIDADDSPRNDVAFSSYSAVCGAANARSRLAPGDGPSASDDAVILYTSGSTSFPKAIPVAHYLIIENGFNIGARQGLGPDDRVLLSPPLFWAYGAINALPAAFTRGAALVLQGRFNASQSLELIERHQCTSIYTLPSMTDALLRDPSFSPERTRSLRTGMTIGSPQDVMKAAVRLGVEEICNVYGSSEIGGNCCVTHHSWSLEQRARSQGLPLPGVLLRIVDEVTGEVITSRGPGLVEVSGPYVMRGYIGASAPENSKAFTADEWFRTGDLGEILADGEFAFAGRSTEMIKRAGINVSPAEVEEIIMQHPAVAQAAVVGVPSEQDELIVAFVIPSNHTAPTRDELVAHCRTLASSYKVPDRFEICESLPQTVTGKLLRRELKKIALNLQPVGA